MAVNASQTPAAVKPDRPGLRQLLLCLSSGLLAALAFSTHSTGWLIWVAFVPWLYVLFSQPMRVGKTAFHTWIFGMGFYIGIIHWLKELHPLTWLGIPYEASLAIVYGGIFGISLVVGLWTAGLGALLGALKPTGWRRVLYPALLWMLMEYGQALGEISLPWARLAVSQYKNLWLLQIVPHTGQLLVSGLIIAFNAALACFVIEFAPDAKPKPYWHYPSFRLLAGVGALIGLNLGFGAAKLAMAPPAPETDQGVYVGAAQGNIAQGQKWSKDDVWAHVRSIEKTYLDLSYDLIKNGPDSRPALLVWPESAVPVYPRLMPEFGQHYSQLAREGKAYLLAGGFDQIEPNGPVYNAATLVTPEGKAEQWYYKRQLVPFGEFFPYRAQLQGIPLLGGIIASLNPMQSDTGRGKDAGLFNTEFGKLGTLICFESVYPQVARASVAEGAELLVIITNDGWYKDAIALYQHLGHAVLRALENGRYVVRAGNTGISAFIDAQGRILAQTKPLERTSLARMLPASAFDRNLTLYTRFGDWPIWLALLLLLGIEFMVRTSHPVEGEDEPAKV